MTAWEEQNWEKPQFEVSLRAERVTLNLEVGQVVYIPGVTDLRDESKATQVDYSMINIQGEIIDLIEKDGKITQRDIAGNLNISVDLVKYYVYKMKREGVLKRVGTSQKGHWEVRNFE